MSDTEAETQADTKRRIDLPSGRSILLVGTAHVSARSVDEVRETIRSEAPDRVCVEIDAGRYRTMTEHQSWAGVDIVKIIKEGKAFLLLANLVLSSFQRKMGASRGVKPGEEMRAAVETARDLGIPCEFADREVQVTLRRAWNKSNLWNRAKLLSTLVSSAFTSERPTEEEIEELKRKSALEDMMGELADYLPTVKEVLIDERDRYLAARIWAGGPGRTVAVIGAGHMAGIESWLGKFESDPSSADVSGIESVPSPGPWGKIIGWALPAALVGVIAYGFFLKGAEFTLEKIVAWVIANGTLSAVGAAAAFGHPLTILVAFLAAPFATLNPFVAVGLFAALTEAFVRKPAVKDFENLHEDVNSVKGFWRNRVTRVLLVFILSSIGGMIGNLVATPMILSLLFK